MVNETKDSSKNCSTIFLLRGVGLDRQSILKHGFISAYIDDINHETHYPHAVYLLYKPKQIDVFEKFIQSEYKRTPLLVEDYDYPGGYIVTVYKFPKEFMEEYQLFLQGKYSKFSKKYTDLFPVLVEVTDENGNKSEKYSLQYHIFNRTSAMKRYLEEKFGYSDKEPLPEGIEYWGCPLIENEVLNINEL